MRRRQLVLVHGLSGSARWWRPVVAPLAARYDLRLLDLRRTPPSHGAAALERELASTRTDVVLVGHSLGGLLAAQVAARRPVHKLVLVSPAGMPSGRPRALEPLALAATLLAVTPRFLPVLAYDALRWGPLALARGGRYALVTDLRPDVSRIGSPTLVLWGEHDRLVPRRLAEPWRDAIPGAHLVIVPHAGHVPMYENPGGFLEALLEFLDDEPGDDAGR